VGGGTGSDSTRIAILYVLAAGRRSIGEIVDSLRLPQGTVPGT
jgi:hypothetical protein